MTEREQVIEALRAVRTGVTRVQGLDDCGYPYAKIRWASVEKILAMLNKMEKEESK